MKAVAEATINELKGRLTGRDQALAELQALLEATKAQWLAQHQTDREEISRLNQALFERNNTSIDNLKVKSCALVWAIVGRECGVGNGDMERGLCNGFGQRELGVWY